MTTSLLFSFRALNHSFEHWCSTRLLATSAASISSFKYGFLPNNCIFMIIDPKICIPCAMYGWDVQWKWTRCKVWVNNENRQCRSEIEVVRGVEGGLEGFVKLSSWRWSFFTLRSFLLYSFRKAFLAPSSDVGSIQFTFKFFVWFSRLRVACTSALAALFTWILIN